MSSMKKLLSALVRPLSGRAITLAAAPSNLSSAVAPSAALGAALVLGLASPAALAQSSVSIYGIVDAAARYTTNQQPAPGQPTLARKELIGGGMSQSRVGFNVREDLGGGVVALANLEHRLLLDTGTQAGTEFWQQSFVGLQTRLGRVSLGRQYNVLFDIYTSTYPSFKYSPFIEAFKPELGFSLGSRANNMAKYTAAVGPWSGELQASASEGSPIGGKTYGAMLRYADGPFQVGGAYMTLTDGTGLKAKGSTIGASYSTGPWYLTASAARNSFAPGFNPLLILAYLTSSTTNGFYGPNIDHRDGVSFGATYQFTQQWNFGGHYWHVKQQGMTASGDGKADFVAFVADYAFTKRTDAYVELDHTKFNGSVTFQNGANDRTGAMVGLRHRF
jgi:predicted porin